MIEGSMLPLVEEMLEEYILKGLLLSLLPTVTYLASVTSGNLTELFNWPLSLHSQLKILASLL